MVMDISVSHCINGMPSTGHPEDTALFTKHIMLDGVIMVGSVYRW